MMMRLALFVTLAILALSNGFAPPAATQCRPRFALSMASVEERAKAKNVNNSTQKASRFRVNQSEEGGTAAAAFREPATPKKSGGGGGLFGLFGGGSKKQNPVEKAASAVSGAVNGATQKSNQPNPKEKASRFRVPSQEEGKTAIRAYNNPSPSKGPTNASSTKWTVPAKYASGGGLAGQSLQSRADAYMKGAISARDFATTLRSKKLDSVAPEIIGSMPEGQKRSALFKMFTQL